MTLLFDEVTQVKITNDTVHLAIKSLWQTVVTNVFTNLTSKNFETIIEWLNKQISNVKELIMNECDDETNHSSSFSIASKLFELVSLFAKQNAIKLKDQTNVKESIYDLSADYSYLSKNDINFEYSLIKTQTKN